MTQEEIQELEKKAKQGDAVAQFNFGLLLVVNNYYEDGRDFIAKAAEQEDANAKGWIEAHNKLTTALETVDTSESMQGKKIHLWNVKKGEQSDEFSFSNLNEGSVIVFVDKSEDKNSTFKHFHTEIISENYFHILFDLWKVYSSGELPASAIKPTKNAKYLISILHYLIENSPDLQVYV